MSKHSANKTRARCARNRTALPAVAAFALAACISAVSAQEAPKASDVLQAPASGPVVVDVRGMSDVLGALGRIERKLDSLLYSRWEYQLVQRNRFDDPAATIQALGAQGWELVAVTVEEGYLFKRRVVAVQ